MSKNLVIVESPAKAKTIEKFLGSEYRVESCYGHVRDLSKTQIGIDIQKGFLPAYEIAPDKKKLIAELRKLSDKAEMVWLATDEDREGEAISWHLAEVLTLDKKKTKRIAFHEITKTAILQAIEKPRSIDQNLVDAQQARRVLDRLVGYELSPVLWKKVKPALSAGRVQSVAVRLLAEREDEIRNFESTGYYKISAAFRVRPEKDNATLNAELPGKLDSIDEARSFLNLCIGARFEVADIETKPAKKSPAPPFTTSTLQQEASRKLGFSVAKTMLVAQQLYESGKITYMRTDSVNLSKMALAQAKEEITQMFGKEYVHTRQFTTKTKGAQEAHEAIRPTYLNHRDIEGDSSQKKLYELIWKRTIASQMSDAILEKTNVTINISNTPEKLIAKGEVIKFDGYLKVYFESSDDENGDEQQNILPPLSVGEVLLLNTMQATERFTQQPSRFTEASLVKKLEELGIGRPSTYAPIISTIQKREYVIKDDRAGYERSYKILTLKNNAISEKIKSEKAGYEKNKLFPTDIGMLVNQFLIMNFSEILDYHFTANVEKEFDEIADGKKAWNQVIREFYSPFHNQVSKVLAESERVKGERLLGIDPESGKNVYVKLGKFGPLVQIGESDDVDKPRFAGFKKGQSLDTITLDEALALFRLPRTVGELGGKPLVIGTGRFGPYVRHGSDFYSLGKNNDPYTIGAAECVKIIEEKRRKEVEKVIKVFDLRDDVKVLNGRWGAYIAVGKNNYRIPKGTEPSALSLDECLKIAQAAPEKKTTRGKSTKR